MGAAVETVAHIPQRQHALVFLTEDACTLTFTDKPNIVLTVARAFSYG